MRQKKWRRLWQVAAAAAKPNKKARKVKYKIRKMSWKVI